VKPSKNKGSNRHSLDIIRDMLSAAAVRARKTRIMYQSNLSFTQVEKYLHSLLENGLLDRDGDSCYLITSKGMDFLKLYGDYSKRCNLIKEQVDRSVQDRLLLERMCSIGEPSCKRKPMGRAPLPEA